MSVHVPRTPSVQKADDPLINLAETNADVQNQRNKGGMLASFLQGRNRSGGFLSNLFGNSNSTSTLGRSGI